MTFNDLSELTSRDELGAFLEKHCPNGHGVEVGVLNGVNAKQILTGWKSGHLYMVDTWGEHDPMVFKEAAETKPDFKACYNECLQIVEEFKPRALMMQLDSLDASGMLFEYQFDMIYIDACHNFCSVITDAMLWWRNLSNGGLMGFHDATYQEPPHKEVKRALEEWNKMMQLPMHVTPSCSSAWFVKP